MRMAWLAGLVLVAGCSEYEIVDYESVDVFHQQPADEVDILMVVDNSCSMGPYQIALGSNFDQFITWFIDANVDYHIGVTTTTIERPTVENDRCSSADYAAIPEAGALVDGTVITSETEAAAEVFQDAVRVGTCGAGFEMGLEAARIALSSEMTTGPNLGFLREGADLSVIFVSDEQDFSPDPVNTYINDLYEVKGQRERDVVNASSLAVTDIETCPPTAAGSTSGTRYIDVAEQTDGVVGNLCSQDFESIVTELSLNTSRLRDTFFLSDDPAPSTLQVSVEDEVWPCTAGSWSYQRVDDYGEDKPAIVFAADSMPQPGEQIAVRYDQGDGDPTLFCADGVDTGGAR